MEAVYEEAWASGRRGPIELIWYDGGIHPPTPAELEEELRGLFPAVPPTAEPG